MPLFKLDKSLLRDEGFTHTGRLNGIVPVYCGDLEAEQPLITTSDWVPEITLDIVDFVFATYNWLFCRDQAFWIVVTGEIDFTDDDDCGDGAHTPCFHHSF